MSHDRYEHEEYDTNLETYNHKGNFSETDRLERELTQARKQAKTFFESMKRVSSENNALRDQIEELKLEIHAMNKTIRQFDVATDKARYEKTIANLMLENTQLNLEIQRR